MPAMIPGELEKQPTGAGSVNKPASGTYGEKAAQERLKEQFPTEPGASGPMQDAQAPLPGPGTPLQGGGDGGRPVSAPAGVPSAILGPTAQPDTPLNTPLAGSGQVSQLPGAQNVAQARVALLQALASSPDVSEETRAWAKVVLEALSAG
jgi:hypothetical protein